MATQQQNPPPINTYTLADKDLPASLALLQATLEATADGIIAFDLAGCITHYNRRFVEMWGIPDTVLVADGGGLGHRDAVLAHILECLENPEKFLIDIRQLYAQPEAEYCQVLELKKSDGRIIECHSLPFHLGSKIAGRVWSFSDITKLRVTESRLRQSIKELSDIKLALDKAAILAITDANGVITYANNKFCELSKYSGKELIGNTHKVVNSQYHNRKFFADLWETISRGDIWKGEIKNRAKDGSYYWVDTTIIPFLDEAGQPFQYFAIRFDITSRKQVEEALQKSQAKLKRQTQQLQGTLSELQRAQTQLVQNEKMTALGQIAAGLAHEINNPVSFIFGNIAHADSYIKDMLHLIELYQKYGEPLAPEIAAHLEEMDLEFMSEDLPKLLASMKVGAERIREIVLSLRNFSRLDESGRKRVDIHEGIESTLLLLQNRLHGMPDGAIEVIKTYGNLPAVECCAADMNQVFMSILSNAIDALESQPGPRQIQICTEVVAGGDTHEDLPLDAGSYAVIRIADNGPGMPLAVKNRIFDPFFTTKAVGYGTGMGLSIGYQIVVEKHGGHLYCISEPGHGTELVIAIPVGGSTGPDPSPLQKPL
ncbi:MAG TPA: PAS domain-containing sensor histidine kinase [Oscillatoriaceae cyanobacterium M33_DOE_052]|nr:PAS domain-containing sensor histidine kinase [Oscillatoriaceae cyanobacterium M33_DOE_052]